MAAEEDNALEEFRARVRVLAAEVEIVKLGGRRTSNDEFGEDSGDDIYDDLSKVVRLNVQALELIDQLISMSVAQRHYISVLAAHLGYLFPEHQIISSLNAEAIGLALVCEPDGPQLDLELKNIRFITEQADSVDVYF